MIGETTNWGAGLFGGVMWLLYVAWIVLVIAGMWKTFVKAGEPGWGAIIPFYNLYLMIKIAGRPGWWLILYFIPFVSIIILLIVSIDIAKNFGHGGGFGVLLWLFAPIMYLVLGFGDSQYKQVANVAAGYAQPPMGQAMDQPIAPAHVPWQPVPPVPGPAGQPMTPPPPLAQPLQAQPPTPPPAQVAPPTPPAEAAPAEAEPPADAAAPAPPPVEAAPPESPAPPSPPPVS